jgi:hypothetical protein
MGIENVEKTIKHDELELNEGLSDEERAALDDNAADEGVDDDASDDAGADPGGAEDGKDGAGDDKPGADVKKDEDGKAGEEDAAKAGDDASGKKPDGEAAASAEAVAEAAPFVPRYPAKEERLGEIDTRLKAIKDQNGELFEKFEKGELTNREYHDQTEALREEQMRLVSEQATIKTAQEYNTLTAEQQWEHDQRAFFGTAENKVFFALDEKGEVKRGEDGTPEFDPIAYGALDAAVKSVAASKEAQGKSGAWVLAEARRRVAQKLNLGDASKPAAPAKPQGAMKGGKPKTGPVTLAGVPAAEAADDLQGDEFAELDRLIDNGDVLAYESALAALTPEQQNRYLNVGHPGAQDYRRRVAGGG